MGRITALCLLFILALSLALPILNVFDLHSTLVAVGVVFVGILVVTLVLGRYRTEEDEVDDSGIWSIIPNRQYEGRFAESGGLARAEQERELENIRDQASKRK